MLSLLVTRKPKCFGDAVLRRGAALVAVPAYVAQAGAGAQESGGSTAQLKNTSKIVEASRTLDR